MRPAAADHRGLSEELFARAAERLARARPPGATYRLQLHAGFGFAEAAALVPYLSALGITELYSSPILLAAPGSEHGYDVIDHTRIAPTLGGDEGLSALSAALRSHRLGWLLDFVPNHMGIATLNPYWQDVLENGAASVHAPRFDIDWRPTKAELADKVLLPILGDQYGAVLEAGELRLVLEGGAFTVRYYEHVLPINPRQYRTILHQRIEELEAQLGKDDPQLQELLSICTACENLPHRTASEPEKVEERHREKEIIKRRLSTLLAASEPVRAFVDENVRIFNGTPGEPRSFDLLDKLLDAHAYRLAHWRVAAEQINYRRFFDINDLAAIRMEDPAVFREAHERVLALVREGQVQGLRIDHPDGLYDPRGYFRRLQEEHFLGACRTVLAELQATGKAPPEAAFDALADELRLRYDRASADRGSLLFRPLYVVAEKILARGESVPAGWAIHGTTGYDFLNQVNGLFVDRAAERAIDEIYARFTGHRLDFDELGYAMKKLILRSSMASELEMLAHQLDRMSERDRRSRDFTRGSLRAALVEYIACFPAYRTYVDASGAEDRDRAFVERAIARARRRNPTINASIFDFLRALLLLKQIPGASTEDREAQLHFAMKLQQLTAPVTAKGLEDTAFYLYNRLISLNEVGGEPAVFGIPAEELHRANRERLLRYPGSLLATRTHDTKRGEDSRTRIDAISELPAEWRRLLPGLSRVARRYRTAGADEPGAPDRNEEILLYQSLIGLWPLGGDDAAFEELVPRFSAFAVKAAREAKANTSWLNSDPAWEQGLTAFAEGVLRDRQFRELLRPFAERVARIGMYGSLSQLVLKVASPGVPDFFQGTELWDLSLVDPDNRRPVDFALRRELLAELQRRAAVDPGALARELWAEAADGRVKLYVTWRSLAVRRDQLPLFLEGDYTALACSGPRAAHVVALARRRGSRMALAVVPRLMAQLSAEASPWGHTHLLLPEGSGRGAWRDAFTGVKHVPEVVRGQLALPVAGLLGVLPVALLQPAS